MENATFPLDILELIVSAVASQSSDDDQTDQTDLRSCSLVCKDLVPISRRHIFQAITITLDDETSYTKTEHLTRILGRQPSIGVHIRRITCWFKSLQQSSPPKAYQWEDPVFLPLLLLPNVDCLEMVAFSGHMSYDMCSQSFFGFRALLEHYLLAGSLKRLLLQGFDDLPLESIVASPSLIQLTVFLCNLRTRTSTDIIFSEGSIPSLRFADLCYSANVSMGSLFCCSQLEHLHLRQISLSHENLGALVESHRTPLFPKLHTLWTESNIAWGMMCNAAEAANSYWLPTLQNLHITLHGEDDIGLVSGMLNHIESLVELVVEHDLCDRYYQADNYPLDIRRVMFNSSRTLKRVRVNWMINGYSERIPENICDALEGVQSKNVIEDLKFSLRHKLHRFELDHTSHQWKRFADVLLQNSPEYPQLKKVRIVISLDEYGFNVEEEETARRLLEAPFASLRETSLFEFSLEVNIRPAGI